MDRQTKINDFVISLEGLSSSINKMAFEVSDDEINLLAISIFDYIHNNYKIPVTQEEFKEVVDKVYQKKHLNLKNSIDNNIGIMKYNLEDQSVNIDSIIQEEITHYKNLFTCVGAGTNVSYLGLVDECTQNVMAMLIRRNTSIGFAKRTEEVKNYIYNLVNDNFFKVMVRLGDTLLDNGILPIEEDFKVEDTGRSKIKS